jgi:hypothetical protein
MHVTRRELAEILEPPLNPRYLVTLLSIAGIEPSGRRRTGAKGHPPNTYDLAEVCAAHAQEAARTAKQFTDADWIASALLGRSMIRADTAAGELWWPDGTRAEKLHAALYGWVEVGPACVAAHRVIWIAAEGEIPPGLQVNHMNRLRWDNRRPNLELVTFGNNVRHAFGTPYLNYHDAVRALADLPPADPPPKVPALAADLTRAGGVFRLPPARRPGH